MYKGTHTYDPVKNRMYTVVEGMMLMKDVEEFIIEGKNTLDQAQPGFTCIIDYAHALASPADVNDRLGELRDYLASKQPKAVATIVGKSLAKAILSQKLRSHHVDATTLGSPEEAHAYLDRLE